MGAPVNRIGPRSDPGLYARTSYLPDGTMHRDGLVHMKLWACGCWTTWDLAAETMTWTATSGLCAKHKAPGVRKEDA